MNEILRRCDQALWLRPKRGRRMVDPCTQGRRDTMPPDYLMEMEAAQPVCGVDEVGRGPWAGPVVAAAVMLDPGRIPERLDDSKKLPAARREALAAALGGCARVGVGMASVEEIDAVNILQASFLAMRRAVIALAADRIGLVLVDGNKAPDLGWPARAVIGGDALCLRRSRRPRSSPRWRATGSCATSPPFIPVMAGRRTWATACGPMPRG